MFGGGITIENAGFSDCRICYEIAILQPALIPFRFNGIRIISLGELWHRASIRNGVAIARSMERMSAAIVLFLNAD